MWQEFSEQEAIQTMNKYGVFVLTPQRKHLLGNALLNLENKNIKIDTAKMQLKNQILFNKDILNALEEAAVSEFNDSLLLLDKLKTKRCFNETNYFKS